MRIRAIGPCLWTAVLCVALTAAAFAEPRADAERTAEQLNQQARQLWEGGRYSQGQPLAQRALAFSEKALGPEHLLTAQSLNNLAHYYLKTGAYDQAEPLYRRVLAIREKALGTEHPDIAASLNNLAILYGSVGDYARAEPLHRRALAIREKTFGPQHPETAKSLTNLAILYLDTGEYPQAEPLFQRSLTIREQTLGAAHPDTAAALLNLATVYYYTGAYEQAEATNLRALAIYEKALEPRHPDIAGPLNNLGQVYVEMRAYSRAMAMYERALAIREAALGHAHPLVAASLSNMASVHRMLGELDRAEPLYQRALAINAARLGPQHPGTANSLNNLGNLYFDSGDYGRAEPLYTRALAIREHTFGGRHPDTAQSLSNLALLSWARGQRPQALSLLQRARDIEAKNSEQFLYSGSQSRQRDYFHSLAEDTFVRVSFSMAATNRAEIELGLNSVLQFKGRVLETASDNLARLRRSIGAEDRVLLDQLALVAQQASAVLYQDTSDASPTERNRRLSELTRQQDALEAQLAKRSSEFRQHTRAPTLAGIKRALPADAALVEWIRYEPFDPAAKSIKTQWGAPRYAAYVLTSREPPTVIDLGDATALDRLATNFNRAVSDANRADVRRHAAALSDKLIEPLLPRLRDYSRWLLAPDGALNLVSMAALLDGEGRYLAEHFEISYLSSGRDLLRMATPAARSDTTGAVLVADPDYGASPLAQASYGPQLVRQSSGLPEDPLVFKPLPGTALEAQALQSLLDPHTQLLMQRAASEEQLRRLHGPPLLHIATHGFFLRDAAASSQPDRNPLLRAGLALAGANLRHSGADDGILTALEMAQLDLRGTQLVVLSACETAQGEAAGSEGIYGMRRALVLAGAETQVTSLWQVPDQPTRLLMVNFYRRLLQGAGRSAALRAAQRDMMADPATAHPYYWAAFVPAGNWQPLALRQ